MPELILPGVYIEERAEALIVSGPISIGNIGIVGTAYKGPSSQVQVLGSYADATQLFGAYDPLNAPTQPGNPLTLVRALEQAYNNGASTVLAVRLVTGTAKRASLDVHGGGGTVATLTARGEGLWGDNIKVQIDTVDAQYVIVRLTYGTSQESYTVTSGNDLVTQITNLPSTLVTASSGTPTKPDVLAATNLANGKDGNDVADYAPGLDLLLNENAHIIVAAGKGDAATQQQLLAHVQNASTDKVRRERIAVWGPDAAITNVANAQPGVASDRMIVPVPGVQTFDAAANAPTTLHSSYTAAAVAGMISARDPQVSLTNKEIVADGLEAVYTPAQLEQLLLARFLALEQRDTRHVVKGITTDTGAFRQITTRRIVDYGRIGVRANAEPYIGLLNNDRVRKALKGSINGFLAGMMDDEQLESYDLDVTATRDEEIRGIAKVTMTLQPVFSIDYIKVVMFLG